MAGTHTERRQTRADEEYNMDRAELCLVDFGFCIEMPTVISAVPTLEGFVIGSDGRSCGPDGEIKSDDVQKVFPVDSLGGRLVYALVGVTTFGYSRSAG